MADDDPQTVTLPRSTIVRAGIVVAILAALGIGFAIGYTAHSPSQTAARSVSQSSKSTTTTAIASTTTSPATEPTTTTATGPTLATCTHAVTGYYFPGQNPAVQLGGLSTVQAVGYGCENQVMLSQAMGIAGHGTVYNSDVLTMAQDVCNNYPNSPLCVNG